MNRRRNAWLVLALVLGVIAGARIAGVALFMHDHRDTRFAVEDHDRFGLRHNCLTAYVVSTELAERREANLYLRDHYKKIRATTTHQTIGKRFTIDTHQYPPPFLLVSGALKSTGGDFFRLRFKWFVLSLLVFTAALVGSAIWCGGHSTGVMLCFVPLILIAPVTLVTLQMGNVHLLVIGASVGAMLAFRGRQHALGGILLAFAIVTKLFPGVLVLYLLIGRRWRAVIFTATALLAFCGGTALIYGLEPYRAFFDYQLPRLLNGDAFAFARSNVRPLQVNLSVYGAIFKVAHLGWVTLDPFAVGKIVSWSWTVVVLLAAILLARKQGTRSRAAEVRMWLVILILAQLRNPFLPWPYGVITPLWLLVALAAPALRRPVSAFAFAAAWLILSTTLPLPVGPTGTTFTMVYSTVGTVTVLVAVVLALRARDGRSDRSASQHRAPASTG